jgi:hypothetical protein
MRWRRSAGPMTAGNSRTHRRVSWSRGGAIGRLVRSDLFLAALRELAARGWSARAHTVHRQDIPADISPQKPQRVVDLDASVKWPAPPACGSRTKTSSAAATKNPADNTMMGSLVRMVLADGRGPHGAILLMPLT